MNDTCLVIAYAIKAGLGAFGAQPTGSVAGCRWLALGRWRGPAQQWAARRGKRERPKPRDWWAGLRD